ncbi:MAG: nitroreductase family protein [Acidimicrobiia bacterium]
MEFRDVLAKRRMVRNYTEEPVDQTKVDRIVDAGLRSPSAGNSQGFGFIVVSEPSLRAEIAELAGESEYVAQGFDPWISKAPIHIVISVSKLTYLERYREADKLGADGAEIDWPVPYWWIDAGAALMAILLAAVDEGMAAGFLGVHSIPELRQTLEIPSEHHPIGVVTIGHAAPDRRSGSLERGQRPRNLVVHNEVWGS